MTRFLVDTGSIVVGPIKEREGKFEETVLLFLLIVASCAGVGKLPQKPMLAMMDVINVPGMAKERIFKRTAEWSATYLQTENADAKSGIILAKGEVCYPSRNKDRGTYDVLQ
jgi:hypothetical protein